MIGGGEESGFKKTNIPIPIINFIPFDLSPVIKTVKKRVKIIKNSKSLNLAFLCKDLSKKYPIIINMKPFKNAPTTGSSLKKLTILSPYNSPYPRMFLPK